MPTTTHATCRRTSPPTTASTASTQGCRRSGQTLAVVSLAAVDPGAPEYFWSNIAHVDRTGSFTVENVDGGPGTPSDASGTGETDLDIEQSGALAPGANVILYQAPNTDYGFADAFFSAASDNIASSVSASWGESETYLEAAILSGQEASAYEAAFDEAFLEMGVQGQSGFLASGDAGAYDASADLGTTNLSVDTSADSPYITAAGGTTLPWTGTLTGTGGTAAVTVSSQRIWGWDYLWRGVREGYRRLARHRRGNRCRRRRRRLQRDRTEPVLPARRARYADLPRRAVRDADRLRDGRPGAGRADRLELQIHARRDQRLRCGRAVPDVGADADPFSGYLLYEPSFAAWASPCCRAAGVARASWRADERVDRGHRLVPGTPGRSLDPSIYAAALSARLFPFTPLNTEEHHNDNIYYTATPVSPTTRDPASRPRT